MSWRGKVPTIPFHHEDVIVGLLQRLAMLRGWSHLTTEAYRSDLLHADAFFCAMQSNLMQADQAAVLKYLASLNRDGLKESTIQRRRSSLSTWFSYVQEQGTRDDHPARHLPKLRKSRPLPKLLSEKDVETLLNAPDTTTALGLRDRCMLEILYATGLRVSELVGLRLASLDMAAGLLRVIGKGDKERLIPFGEEADHWLNLWLAKRPAEPTISFLFAGRGGKAMTRQNFWQRIKKHAKDAKLRSEPSPHTLRHAFATHLLNHGADLRAVQMLLGHANVTTTEIYTHVTRARLHDVVNAAHPLGKR
ncbi:MAG: site-specific tyrosine recombinase XerD [Mariprofundus sp.]|nr:site-specific tyrosine recombinase XerD [Mariprofundus sp.]